MMLTADCETWSTLTVELDRNSKSLNLHVCVSLETRLLYPSLEVVFSQAWIHRGLFL